MGRAKFFPATITPSGYRWEVFSGQVEWNPGLTRPVLGVDQHIVELALGRISCQISMTSAIGILVSILNTAPALITSPA